MNFNYFKNNKNTIIIFNLYKQGTIIVNKEVDINKIIQLFN